MPSQSSASDVREPQPHARFCSPAYTVVVVQFGRTAWDFANEKGHTEIAAVLEAAMYVWLCLGILVHSAAGFACFCRARGQAGEVGMGQRGLL